MKTTEVLLGGRRSGGHRLDQRILARNRCPSRVHAVTDGVEAVAFLRGQGGSAGAPLPTS